ncbi:intercellular adhesion molecule 5-like [Hemiscyllium ocellatum]|uniref:intercellular adhesion molecule 5-like n=1 Tax=Hemiscyllium ocellatum TaxID=170820 RepID=UPI002965D7E4|nr:intercellular adhesion molecule 5-like [Hemiscyllium ocellatum]
MLLSSMYSNIILSVLAFWIQTTVTGFEVSIDVKPPAVEFGGSIGMNCSTTCPKPTIHMEYKPGVNFMRTNGSTWYHDYFPSVQEWDLTLACAVNCLDPQLKNVKKHVTVYNREINITVLPEVLEINRTYRLECTGPRVYPNNKLILTWLRGSEIVQRDSTGELGLPDEDKRLRNVFNFVASQSDDGQEYTCLAEVDSGSNTTKSITNSSVTLQTYAFMDQPRILDKRPKEVKREVTLTCEVSNVYPAEKMRVRWFQDGVELNSDTTRPNSNTVRITAAWTPQESGLMEVVCMADFEKYPSIPPKNDSAFIEVYAFSSPEIQVPTTQEGNLVNITCRVLNVSGDLELRLKKGNDTLVNGSSSTGLTISHTVEAEAKLDGQQYICEAELKLQDHSMTSPVIKQHIGTLHVLYREISITLLPKVLEINRSYSLECIGPRVYPNNKLILTWLRGSEILQRNSTGEPGSVDEDKRLRNDFNFIASQSDDGQEYTCLAEVDLGSQTTKSITNSSVTLQTYAFMDQPKILDKRPKEVKREVTLTCEVSNVYPAEKMRVRWFQDGVELNSDTTRPNSNTVRITAAWTPQESGLMEVVCMADFEKYPSIPSKNNSAFIEVYGQTTARRLAAKIIGLSSVVIIAGELLFITITYCIKQNKKK